MASKKPEGDSKKEKEEKNKTGHQPKKGREQGKAGQNPENAFTVTSLPFPQRPLTWEAQRPFTVLKPALQGRGGISLFLNAFFVGKQWTVSEGLHKCLSNSLQLPGSLRHL